MKNLDPQTSKWIEKFRKEFAFQEEESGEYQFIYEMVLTKYMESFIIDLIRDVREDASISEEVELCSDCKHPILNHKWQGIPSGEWVTDRCHNKDCTCVNESNKTYYENNISSTKTK